MESLLLPDLASLLVYVKHGHVTIRDPDICLSKTYSMFVLKIAASVVIPILVTFLLDETCLHYYLLLSPDLRSVLTNWSLADIGPTSYKPDICSRGMIAIYAHIWLSMGFISMLLNAIWLSQRDQRLHRLLAKMRWHWRRCKTRLCGRPSQSPDRDELGDVVTESITRIVDLYSLFVVTLVAGPLVPLLSLMMIASLYLQLMVLQRLHLAGQRSFGLEIAETILVSLPAKPFGMFVLAFMWSVQLFVMMDLEFGIGNLLVDASCIDGVPLVC